MPAWDRTQEDWIGEVESLASVARSHPETIGPTAAGTDFESVVYTAPADSAQTWLARVIAVPSAAIAAQATNTVTMTVKRYTKAGAAVASLAGAFTNSGANAIAQFAQQAIATGQIFLNPGDVLTVAVTHAGTGTALPLVLISTEAAPQTIGAPV